MQLEIDRVVAARHASAGRRRPRPTTSAGAGSRSWTGWVIVGGISFGTLFTLFVAPTASALLARTRYPQVARAADEMGLVPEGQAAE